MRPLTAEQKLAVGAIAGGGIIGAILYWMNRPKAAEPAYPSDLAYETTEPSMFMPYQATPTSTQTATPSEQAINIEIYVPRQEAAQQVRSGLLQLPTGEEQAEEYPETAPVDVPTLGPGPLPSWAQDLIAGGISPYPEWAWDFINKGELIPYWSKGGTMHFVTAEHAAQWGAPTTTSPGVTETTQTAPSQAPGQLVNPESPYGSLWPYGQKATTAADPSGMALSGRPARNWTGRLEQLTGQEVITGAIDRMIQRARSLYGKAFVYKAGPYEYSTYGWGEKARLGPVWGPEYMWGGAGKFPPPERMPMGYPTQRPIKGELVTGYPEDYPYLFKWAGHDYLLYGTRGQLLVPKGKEEAEEKYRHERAQVSIAKLPRQLLARRKGIIKE